MSEYESQVQLSEETQSEIDVGLLVETIQQYEFLYNMRHPEYKNSKKKDLAWEEISVIVNCSVADCQKTWKSLRDRFTKEKNKMRSGSEAPESNWTYYNLMLFYSKYSKPRKTYTSTKTAAKDIPSRPSTSHSVWSSDELIFSSSSHHSVDDDVEQVAAVGTPSTPTSVSEGMSQKRKRNSPNEAEGILNLVKNISTSLETVTSNVGSKPSNTNRAFADYVFMRLDEMDVEVAKMKRQQMFQILEA